MFWSSLSVFCYWTSLPKSCSCRGIFTPGFALKSRLRFFMSLGTPERRFPEPGAGRHPQAGKNLDGKTPNDSSHQLDWSWDRNRALLRTHLDSQPLVSGKFGECIGHRCRGAHCRASIHPKTEAALTPAANTNTTPIGHAFFKEPSCSRFRLV